MIKMTSNRWPQTCPRIAGIIFVDMKIRMLVELEFPKGYSKNRLSSKSDDYYDYKKDLDIFCECGAVYCLECQSFAHGPIPCAMWKLLDNRTKSKRKLPLVANTGQNFGIQIITQHNKMLTLSGL
jgi:hypothetical protein